MSDQINHFDDIVAWATWKIIEDLTGGRPLRQSVHGVLVCSINMLEDLKKRQKEAEAAKRRGNHE